MKKIKLKKIIGVLVATHVIPVICVIVFAVNPEEKTPIHPYFFGWAMNFLISILFGVIKFIAWCFDE